MLAVALCAAAGIVLVRTILLPSYREWRDLQSELHARAPEYARLARNLAYRQSADEEFERLPREAFQRDPEQITLAAWLRELETAARRPSLVLVNTKPMPVRHEAGYGVYTVKLSISGRLAEVLQFVSDAVSGPTVAGLGSFSMRAVQGGDSVECSFDLRMVKLAPPRESQPRRGAPAAPSTPGGG
jgi:Tfp pilus assembly protein PilO